MEPDGGLQWDRSSSSTVPLLDLGEPGGHTLVLLPGLTDGLAPVTDPASRALFAAVPLPLSRYRGLVLSYPQPLSPGVTTDQLAAMLRPVLEARLTGPAVLVGHSMGAMVAQHLAVEAPDLVAGLVLSASAARADEQLRGVLARWDRWLVAGEVDRFQRDAIATSVTGAVRAEHLALHAAAPTAPIDPRRIARHLVLSAACAAHDATDRLHGVAAPALVMAGGRDQLVAPAAAEELAALLPEARFHCFDDLGHGFPEQARGPYQATVATYLRRLGW